MMRSGSVIVLILLSHALFCFERQKNMKEGSARQSFLAQVGERPRTDSLLQIAPKGSPVIGNLGDTLFYIYARLGSFSPKDRAKAVSKRLSTLAENYFFTPDSLYLMPWDAGVDIMYGQSVLLTVSESDAEWENVDKERLAQRNRKLMLQDIEKYKLETSLTILVKEAGIAVLILLVLSVIILLIGKFFKRLRTSLYRQRHNYFEGLKIKHYTLVSPRYQTELLLGLVTLSRWVFTLFVIYLTLPLLFSLFPWTEEYAQVMIGYILSPVKKIVWAIWGYLPNLFTLIVIAVLFRYILKGLRFLKNEIETGQLVISGFYADWAGPTFQIIRLLTIAFMIVVAFPFLPGNDSRIFQGISVFLGFLFTFSSASSLSNMVAGLVLTYMRLYKIGDRVKIGEVSGDVIEKSALVTRIRTIKNEIVILPNSSIMTSHTINYSAEAEEKGLIIHTTLTLGYDIPWRKIHEALLEAAHRTEMILKNPEPFVLQTGLDDFYVAYQLNAYVREANRQSVIYSLLHQNIQDICNERGIEILSPHYRAVRDGNTTTIPSDYLPDDYKSPAFNVSIENKHKPLDRQPD